MSVINNEIQHNFGRGELFFESFDLAFVSKVMLIHKLNEKYDEEILRLQTVKEKNKKGLSDYMQIIQRDHSEYLI